jgi:hypothetical protein
MKCSRTLHCILIAFALLHPSAFAQEEAVVDLDRDAPVTASSSDEHEAKKHDATHKKIDESIDSNVVPTPDETLEAKNKVDANENPNESVVDEKPAKTSHVPLQSGPLIDLLGHQLLSLEMIDETSAQLKPHYTNEVLNKAKVIGIYFSADWYVHNGLDKGSTEWSGQGIDRMHAYRTRQVAIVFLNHVCSSAGAVPVANLPLNY